DTKNGFLVFPEIQGLDGAKKAALLAKPATALTPQEAVDRPLVEAANMEGGRMALKVTAAIPLTMAVFYLLLILYFKAKGGYRPAQIVGSGEGAREVKASG
ncbi:MAG TPA: hypothetical protein PLN52_09665, partial [Opitutaceae bacterium]|nr:hypothetical protein [Opitutaceae bacterium]